MNLHQKRFIPSHNPWEPCFFGAFFAMDDIPCFLYDDRNRVCMLPLTHESPWAIDADLAHALPSRWTFLQHGGQPYLFIKPNVAIDLRQGEQLPDIPEALRTQYLESVRPEKYFEEYPFCFDDYCISHKGYCGYRCTKEGKTIWEFTGRAYLYTEITRWNNRVFFGTAGHGGYFYILDLDTGEAIASIKTGGTASIAQMGHLCFVACRGAKRNCSKLLCVDLRNGKIVQELDLHGGVSSYSRLQLIGQQLHIVTFVYKGELLQNAIWNVVDI